MESLLKKNIKKLLKKRNAILLAHNYQPPDIQDVADLCGDSLELSIKASKTDADIIVFCGVHFMAETASILSPEKTVLLPREDAGCPMAEMISADVLRAKLDELPPMPVVTYVNSPASVKALSTVCCTSANAVKVVQSLDADEVMMVPDRNLSQNTARWTQKKIHFWNGFCPFHDLLRSYDVHRIKAEHPEAAFIAHPECRPEVTRIADAVLSTSGMLAYVKESNRGSFIVGTEVGLLYPLQKENPGAKFYPASTRMVCGDMKKISLDDIITSLETLNGQIKVPEDIRLPALAAVQRMIDLSV